MARRMHGSLTPRDLIRGRLSAKKLGLVLAVGFVVGILLGYALMGTLHAFYEIGASQHHGSTPGGSRAVAEGAGTSEGGDSKSGDSKAVGSKAGVSEASGAARSTPATVAASEASDAGKGTRAPHGVHSAVTSNGSPYLNWQTRIMYQTYLAARSQKGGERMVGFTRILHRASDDEFMGEIPTHRVQPLHPKCDSWCEYPVADRPNAVAQFLAWAGDDPSRIRGEWLFLIETDYVFLKPVEVPGAPAAGSDGGGTASRRRTLGVGGGPSGRSLSAAKAGGSTSPRAFLFGYIQPAYGGDGMPEAMRKLYPESAGPLSGIPRTGPAPALMTVAQWGALTPTWERLTAQIEGDESIKAKLGWVREMYAFSVAAALEKISLDVLPPPASPLLAQPPADHTPGEACALHYTWGAGIVDANGTRVWRFDKRDYTPPEFEHNLPWPKPLPEPYDATWKQEDGKPLTKDLYATLSLMGEKMRAAVKALGVDVS